MIYNLKTKTLLKFTNLLVKKGKKAKAASIFLKTLFLLKKKTKKNPINFLYSAIKNLTPGVSTRKTVVAGRLYHLPCAISTNKSLYFGCNWLQQSATTSKEGSKNLSLSDKLASECFKILKKKGNAILFLKQHNKIVSDNRPFLRFVRRKRSLRLPRKVFLRKRKILFLKRRRKNLNSKLKHQDSYDFNLNNFIKYNKIYPHDTKLETKFQSKIDRKFQKIDKKRNFITKLNIVKSNLKNPLYVKSKLKLKAKNEDRKKSKNLKNKQKNKVFNKKN